MFFILQLVIINTLQNIVKIRLKERNSSHSSTSTSIIAWITASRVFFLNVIFLHWGGGTYGKLLYGSYIIALVGY